MRYHPIDPALFIQNRKRLYRELPKNALVIIQSNDVPPRNADGVIPFEQNSDLFYLTGIDQAATILALHYDVTVGDWKAALFLTETNEHLAIWEGKKYSQAAATACSGIQAVHWLSAFENQLKTLMKQAECVYLLTNEHVRNTSAVPTRNARFITWCQEHYPLHPYRRLAPVMEKLRMVKSNLEIGLIQQACDITAEGFQALLPQIKPGMMEYELEAILSYEFLRRRSRGFAYNPIVASGANACVLHYEANNQPCREGDLILLDVGAEYANYRADVTRVVPVNGKFTKRQKDVYNAVLCVLQQAAQLLTPGNTMQAYQQAVAQCMEKELVDLGLLSLMDIKKQDPKQQAYRKYFMHGVSHHLGLATHDVGDVQLPFAPGMVLTIEPGIYIREEGLGIRLENDYVIRENGAGNLTAAIPIDAEEIEALMHEK